MSFVRKLTGRCDCGRNRYEIQLPPDTTELAQVLFASHPPYRSPFTTPLLRIPLAWCRSTTQPFLPDETQSKIRRVFSFTTPIDEALKEEQQGEEEEGRPQHTTMRHFCGFCGDTLSYWSEQPQGEGEFIRLVLGTLAPADLVDLEELGFLPGSPEEEGSPQREMGGEEGAGDGKGISGKGKGEEDAGMEGSVVGEELTSFGHLGSVGVVPWFDRLLEGSALGRLRRTTGRWTNPAGTVRVAWEVDEWTADDGAESPRKRKLDEVEGAADVWETEGMQD
ncbi:hypothetical protein VTI74DRAFT_3069 [Chaetomium olivicolor]